MNSTRPKLQIVCGICDKPIPAAQDVWKADSEWQQRHPELRRLLVHATCITDRRYYWWCDESHHVGNGRRCMDSWSHVEGMGTHVAMALLFPHDAVNQGARAYLQWWLSKYADTGEQETLSEVASALAT